VDSTTVLGRPTVCRYFDSVWSPPSRTDGTTIRPSSNRSVSTP
jgi:hypothetical protein